MARCAVAVCAAAAAAARGAPPAAGPLSRLLAARLQPLMDAAALRYNTSYVAGVQAAGESVGLAAGVDDHATGRRMTARGRFPSGSVTKTYTSVAVMQLHERGLLDIDAPIHRYVDPFLLRTNGTTLLRLWKDPQIEQVTARQLMGMRGGLDDYPYEENKDFCLNPKNFAVDITPYDYLTDRWAPKRILYPPGKGSAYSSDGYVILGLALAGVTNATAWTDFDQRSIFPPALAKALPDFTFPLRGPCSRHKGVVHQYALVDGEPDSQYWDTVKFEDIYDGSCLNGWTMGNLAGSPRDIATALYHVLGAKPSPRLVSDASMAQMLDFKPLSMGWSVDLPYGLGLMKHSLRLPSGSPKVDPSYLSFVGHGGEDYGSTMNTNWYSSRMDLTLVVATNSPSNMNCSLPLSRQHGGGGSGDICFCAVCLLVQHSNSSAWPGGCDPFCDPAAVERRVGAPPPRALPLRAAALRSGAQRPLHCASAGCVGASAALPAAECEAWKELHGATGGAGWAAGRWADPCACAGVSCSPVPGGRSITAIELPRRGLAGPLPTSIAAFRGLRALDLGGNRLFGVVPASLARLTALTRLSLAGNLFSGRLPPLDAAQYSAGCDVSGNDFSCPLPAGAAACRTPDGPAPTCNTLQGRLSQPCILGMGRLWQDGDVQQYRQELEQAQQVLDQKAYRSCGEQMWRNHGKCHAGVNWSNYTQLIDGFRGAVQQVDSGGDLCFMNLQKNQTCEMGGKHTCEYFLTRMSAQPLPGECTAADRVAYLAYMGRPSQCIMQDGDSCEHSFADANCTGA